MSYPELNERNVMLTLKKILCQESTKNSSIIIPVVEEYKGTKWYRNTDILNQEYMNIKSMFGQTRIVHDR